MHEFENDEFLFRKIPFNPLMTNEYGITSAAFKDSLGCSVDRKAERNLPICKECILNHFGYDKVQAIAAVTVSDCNEKDMYIKSCPADDNKYHCEIHKNADEVQLTQSQARHLAKKAIIIHKHEASNLNLVQNI